MATLMVEPMEEVEALRAAVAGGSWTPTDAERSAARSLLGMGKLESAAVRRVLPSEHRGPFFAALERVAMVLDLPTLHEDAASRPALMEAVSKLLCEVAGSP
jgi:hypothetical protein